MGKRTDKALGPQPAGRMPLPGLASASAPRSSPIPVQGPAGEALARHHAGALAQGHYVGPSPVPGVAPIDSPAHLDYQPAPEPQPAVTLTMRAANPANPMNLGVGGQVPSVTVQVLDASQASSLFGGEVRAEPRGAGGLNSSTYRGEHMPARLSPGHEPTVTPIGAPGAVHHLERLPGELQGGGVPPRVDAPGAAWSTRPPGDAA